MNTYELGTAGMIILPKDVAKVDDKQWAEFVKERRCTQKGRGTIYSNLGAWWPSS